MQVYADDFKETHSIEAGNIGVVCGFKQTVTGDTLVSSEEHYNQAKWRAEKFPNDKGEMTLWACMCWSVWSVAVVGELFVEGDAFVGHEKSKDL